MDLDPGTSATPAQRVVLGHLVGDALGVPYEFHAPDELPEVIDMQPPAGFHRAHRGTPCGTWSDDGALMLAVADNLLTHGGRIEATGLATSMVDWMRRGRFTPDGRVFDIGGTTRRALRRVGRRAPERCGDTSRRSNGNGSLMRTAPLAVLHRGTDQELLDDACLQSRITHAHPISQACCALHALWGRRMARGDDAGRAWDTAVSDTLDGLAADLRASLTEALAQDWVPGSGYVVASLQAARRLVIGSRSYRDAVIGAIRLGDDTDTTACITGAYAALALDELPPAEWLGQLRTSPELERILEAAGTVSP